MNQINLTWVVVAVIIGISTGGSILGVTYLNNSQRDKEAKVAQDLQKSKEVNADKELLLQRGKLQGCLTDAQDKFNDIFELNSTPAPQPNRPDVRTWKSANLAEDAQKTLSDDKALCARLYGQ